VVGLHGLPRSNIVRGRAFIVSILCYRCDYNSVKGKAKLRIQLTHRNATPEIVRVELDGDRIPCDLHNITLTWSDLFFH
jgi:hypothetical protein